MVIEQSTVPARVHIPPRFRNRPEIDQAAHLIEERAAQGLMLPHAQEELRTMARRGQLVTLVVEEDGKKKVVGVGGITAEHRRGPLRRVYAAEFGALATAVGHERNGYGSQITRAATQHYLREGFLRRLWHTQDIQLFAMVATENADSNRMFQRIDGIEIPLEQLPPKALEQGTDYRVYDITHIKP